jgi:hypothetical protein
MEAKNLLAKLAGTFVKLLNQAVSMSILFLDGFGLQTRYQNASLALFQILEGSNDRPRKIQYVNIAAFYFPTA